jgi:hypothetical protein
MRRVCAAVLAVVFAGCVAAPPPAARPPPPVVLDLAPYLECPVVDGLPVPCEDSGDHANVRLRVEDAVPPGWRCVYRFWPDGEESRTAIHVGVGSGPSENGLPTSAAFALGYEYHVGGEAGPVQGYFQLTSEDVQRVFVWQGPPSGFVRVPVPLSSLDFYWQAGLLPADLGLKTEGLAVDGSSLFWSTSPEAIWQVNATLNVESGRETYHFPVVLYQNRGDPRGHPTNPGYAGGSVGGWQSNATVNVRDGPLRVEASIPPFRIETGYFYGEGNPYAYPGGGACSD